MEHLLTFKMSKRDKFYLFVICLRYKYNRPRNPHTHTHTPIYIDCTFRVQLSGNIVPSLSLSLRAETNRKQLAEV